MEDKELYYIIACWFNNRFKYSLTHEHVWVEVLNGLGEPVIFLGDGVPVFKGQIRERLTVPFSFAPAHVNRQRAAAVAALGARYFAEGKMESSDDHRPDYLRKSQAEREREEREAKEGGR